MNRVGAASVFQINLEGREYVEDGIALGGVLRVRPDIVDKFMLYHDRIFDLQSNFCGSPAPLVT